MYRCDRCKKQQGPGVKRHPIVVKTRRKEYLLPRGRASVGHEIVKEIGICPLCLNKHEQQERMKALAN